MPIKPLQIPGFVIGPEQPVFIIAEAGINHNGSVARARELIDAAAQAGASAIKFQKRTLAEVYQQKILDNPNSAEQKYQYLIPLLKEFELPNEAFVALQAHAAQRRILFLVNPWDKQSCDEIEALLNPPLYKIGSPDLTNTELLEHIARLNKPLILSTGMSVPDEIRQAVAVLRQAGANFALLHCNSTYPAPFDEINLRFMDTLQEYGVPVGYSGHERGLAVSLAAVARGASIIERHITVDKTLDGPDHKASLLPDEFAHLVEGIRETEAALGQPIRKISQGEAMNREILGKSIVAAQFIPLGTTIERSMLKAQSPAKGLSPQRMNEVVGTHATRNIAAGEPLTADDLTGEDVADRFDGEVVPWRWGPVVRWADYRNYLAFNPHLFEFHLSDKDLEEPPPTGRFTQSVVVHAPEYLGRLYLNPAAEDVNERQLAVKTLQRSLDITRRVAESFQGIPKFIVHPGGITLERSADPKKFLDIFADTLAQLRSDGVEILPENLPPRPWVFGGQWQGNIFLLGPEIKQFLDTTGYHLCFDISHAALACNAGGANLIDMLSFLKPYIHHLHLSDAAGIGEEGLQIGQGTINWPAVLAALADYQHTMVPEIWQGHLNGGKGFLQALANLRQFVPVQQRA